MDIKHEIIVNRYKYIIEKINNLDNQYKRNTALAYKILLSLITFVILSKLAFSEGKIGFLSLELGIKSASAITITFFIYLTLLSISHLLSWYDYRKEECTLLESIELHYLRKEPNWKNIYRWSEFYFILLCVFIVSSGIIFFINPNLIL